MQVDYRKNAEDYKVAILELIKSDDLTMDPDKLFDVLCLLCRDYESAVSSAEYAEKRKKGFVIVDQSDLP